MDDVDDTLWQAFERLASQYPHDHGVRMTSDMRRWLTEERLRCLTQQASTPESRPLLEPPQSHPRIN
jgi:hypothetical protein